MSDTNLNDASFTPEIQDSEESTNKQTYSASGSFRFWCQKVLPLVYDDSLSYYELLCKVVNYLNSVIQNVDNLNTSVDNTNTAFNNLQNYVNTTKDTLVEVYGELEQYVNDYFNNLDVQEEINSKLDSMAKDGSLSTIISPFIPAAVSDWLSNNITPTSPAIDASLSVSGAGADAKVTGDRLSELNYSLKVNEINSDYNTNDSISDFATLKNGVSIRYYQPLALGFGYVKADGSVVSDTDTLAYDNNYLSVREGDVITSLGITRDAIRFICAYDYQLNPVPTAGSDSIIYSYRVPSGVSYIRVTLYTDNANDYKTMPTLKIISAKGFYAINEISNVTELKENVHFDIVKTIGAMRFGWVNANGIYHEDTDEVLAHSDFVLVDEGDVIKSNGIGHINMRFITAYDNTKAVIASAGSNDPVATYTVPSGVRYIIITMHVETPHDLTTFPSITMQKNGNYILPIVDETLQSSVYPAPANVIGRIVANSTKTKSVTKRGNLGTSDKWTFEENNISTAKVLSFSGQISEFSAIQMGHGFSETESNYIKIDASNVYEYGGGSLLNTYPHGLSIENTIQVKIEVKSENAYNAYLTLTSNGNTFTQTMPKWYGDSGNLFVESVGSNLNACSFGWTCRNFIKPVYIFGDSYLGYATPNRWAYYLLKDGYNQLIDGYGGRNSSWALKSLKNNLLHGTPKYIFWCMGMNDPDNGAINTSWLNCITELLSICEDNRIVPILATIPNVTRADRDNTYKNEWVRNSGYRYVDFASAVNANVKGATWYTGMLSNDGLHPDTIGAITLYHQVLSDFPEIVIS